MKRHERVWLVGLACALGCPSVRRESLDVAIPAVEPAPTKPEKAVDGFSVGKRRFIRHDDVPSIRLACNAERLAFTDVGGEVMTYSFGDAEPRQVTKTPLAHALAISGDDVYAVVGKYPSWDIAELRGSAWKAVVPDVALAEPNIAADGQSVVWVGRNGESDALFVLDRKSGRVDARSLGNAHSSMGRIVVDRRHAYVRVTKYLYDVELDGTSVRELPNPSEIEDIAATDGLLIGLRTPENNPMGELVVLAGGPARSIAQFPDTFHPTVVANGGVACFFSSNDGTHAKVGCVDLATGVTRQADAFDSSWEFLAVCGGKRLVWTRPGKNREGWDLFYAELLR